MNSAQPRTHYGDSITSRHKRQCRFKSMQRFSLQFATIPRENEQASSRCSQTHSPALSYSAHGYLSVCLLNDLPSPQHPFQLLSNVAQTLSASMPIPRESSPCVSFWGLSLFSPFAWGGTSHTGRPGWIPIHLAWGPSRPAPCWTSPESLTHTLRLRGFKPPPLPFLPTLPYIFLTTTSPCLHLNTCSSCHHHTPSVSWTYIMFLLKWFSTFWLNTSHWCLWIHLHGILFFILMQ